LRVGIWFFLTLLISEIISAQQPPYSYSYVPKFVYQRQVFPVTVLIKNYIADDPPKFEFETIEGIQPLNVAPVKTINKDEAFYTFYFKAKEEKQVKIPSLAIWDINRTVILPPNIIKVKKLKAPKDNFSGLIASKLNVNSVRVAPYDSVYNLVTLNLEAFEANIEDMHIPEAIDDGIENLKREGSSATANYYFIIDGNRSSITFSYYDSMQKKFVEKTILLEYFKNKIESGDLNPKDLSFDKFKKYSLISLALFFLIMLFSTRDRFYIFALLITITILVYIYLPKKIICIDEGTPLYILP